MEEEGIYRQLEKGKQRTLSNQSANFFVPHKCGEDFVISFFLPDSTSSKSQELS